MSTPDDTDETAVVQAASSAAEDVIFSRYDRSAVRDVDVTATYEDGEFEIDVYLDVSEEREDADRVAKDAVLAARTAVDDLLESE